MPRNTHPGSAEILYVVSGAGDVTIGSEKIAFGAEEALHIPDGQPHAAKFTGPDKTVMLQVFAPAGPEERYRAAQPAAPSKRQSDDDQMIDFELSEDQRVLQASVREMCERLIIPNARRWDEEETLPARDRARAWARWACSGCRSPRRTAAPG